MLFAARNKGWYKSPKVIASSVALIVVVSILIYLIVSKFVKSKSPTEEFSNDKKTLYFFKADWCGHCQRFKPVWDDVVEHCNTKNPNNFKGIELVELNIDHEESKPLMQKHGVRGFPHIVITDASDSTEHDVVFNKNRTKEDLIAFIEENM
jgi:thiol-disulfide isomerase/thioredoxin